MIKVAPYSQNCIHIRVGRIDDINQLSLLPAWGASDIQYIPMLGLK